MGLGSIVIESTQSKFYAHWFTGTNLAFVVALDLAWRSVVTIVARATAIPMSNIDGNGPSGYLLSLLRCVWGS